MILEFQVGQRVRIKGTITDPFNANAPIDPTTLLFKVRSPDGKITTYTYGVSSGLIKESVGVYHFDLLFTQSGQWKFRWEGTGNIYIADEELILVALSEFYS